MSTTAAQDFAIYARRVDLTQDERDWCAQVARQLGMDVKPRAPRPTRPQTSQYRGVHRSNTCFFKVWCAACADKYVGQFMTELEAAHAYDRASWARWHDLRRLNFPDAYMDTPGVGEI